MVLSLAGKDKGRLLTIVGSAKEGYVLVADGKLRRFGKPKLKKLKHLAPWGDGAGWSPEEMPQTDRSLRKQLAQMRRNKGIGEEKE